MRKSTRTKSLIVVMSIIFVVFLYSASWLNLMHLWLYDVVYETSRDASDDIVIVGIDNQAYANIGRWPFSRSIQAEIFEKILADQPAVLGIDIIYDAYTTTEEDDRLYEVLNDERVVLAKSFKDVKELDSNIEAGSMLLPFEALNNSVKTGYIISDPDSSDNVVRQMSLLKLDGDEVVYSFALEIFKQYIGNETYDFEAYKWADIQVEELRYIDFVGSSGAYEDISADQVLNTTIPEGFFENKVVLFGPYALGMQDAYFTPIDKTNRTFGIEIHGNIIQSMMEDTFKKDVAISVEIALIVFMALLSFILSNRIVAIQYNVILQLSFLAGLVFLGKIIYSNGYVTEIVYPMASVALVSLSMIIYGYLEQLSAKKRITGIFGKYVAPQVVDRLLEEGEDNLKLGGFRKDISVLFVDIRGFTPLSEVAEPEEVVQILNDYLELCADAVFDNKGTLDKFIGDAAMAIYNAPMDLEDHAYFAVKTAWDMKVKGEVLAKELLERFGRNVHFGIGVNTGKAVVGNIGSKVRMDYTAIGDTVNTSARLESNAKAGQILISKATYMEVKDRVQVTDLGTIKVKGKAEGIEIYQVDGVE